MNYDLSLSPMTLPYLVKSRDENTINLKDHEDGSKMKMIFPRLVWELQDFMMLEGLYKQVCMWNVHQQLPEMKKLGFTVSFLTASHFWLDNCKNSVGRTPWKSLKWLNRLNSPIQTYSLKRSSGSLAWWKVCCCFMPLWSPSV